MIAAQKKERWATALFSCSEQATDVAWWKKMRNAEKQASCYTRDACFFANFSHAADEKICKGGRKMRPMKATMQHKKCGGGPEANHNDRSIDVSKADNIGDISKDSVWIFPEGQKPQRIRLENHELKNFELAYYESRFGDAINAQRERHLKARQKPRAEGCTVKRYYDSKNAQTKERENCKRKVWRN